MLQVMYGVIKNLKRIKTLVNSQLVLKMKLVDFKTKKSTLKL